MTRVTVLCGYKSHTKPEGRHSSQVGAIARLGLVVVGAFAVCWAPFLGSRSQALQVLQRLIPVKRGLYEDYVASFWCVSSPAFKWRRVYSQQVTQPGH